MERPPPRPQSAAVARSSFVSDDRVPPGGGVTFADDVALPPWRRRRKLARISAAENTGSPPQRNWHDWAMWLCLWSTRVRVERSILTAASKCCTVLYAMVPVAWRASRRRIAPDKLPTSGPRGVRGPGRDRREGSWTQATVSAACRYTVRRRFVYTRTRRAPCEQSKKSATMRSVEDRILRVCGAECPRRAAWCLRWLGLSVRWAVSGIKRQSAMAYQWHDPTTVLTVNRYDIMA